MKNKDGIKSIEFTSGGKSLGKIDSGNAHQFAEMAEKVKRHGRNTPTIEIDTDSDESTEDQFKRQTMKIAGFVHDAMDDVKFNGIPSESEFDSSGFMDAPNLASIGKALIGTYQEDFWHLNDAKIVYLWKQKGGETGGAATLGKCIRPSGYGKYFAQHRDDDHDVRVDYVIWAAADHLQQAGVVLRHVRALIFHELCHTKFDDKGSYTVRTHDFEGFAREIEEFGMWSTSIQRIAEAFRKMQPGLFGKPVEDEEGED